MADPIPTTQPKTQKHVLWTIFVFLFLCAFIVGLIVWQFWGLTPNNWCMVAKLGDKADPSACFNVLIKLLDLKDHIVVGLTATLAVIIVSLAVVVLKIYVKAGGPGGLNLDVGTSEQGEQPK